MSHSRSQSSSYSAHYSDGADLNSEDICIEADGDFDTGPIDVDDEDLNAAFEAEHGAMFTVIDEVQEDAREGRRHTTPKEKDVEKQKYVIPKVKRSDDEDHYDTGHIIGDEAKRGWQKNEREIRTKNRNVGRRDHRGDRDGGKRDVRERDSRNRERNDRQDSRERRDSKEGRGGGRNQSETKREIPQNSPSPSTGPAVKSDADKRPTLFESFAKEGLIADERCTESSVQAKMEGGKKIAEKEESQLTAEEDGVLEIPLGRDSLVFVRDYHVWQVRMHPICKTDMGRADFTQMWAMADSASVVWSNHNDFAGVAEFLLKDHGSIQKFMRKILWQNFSSEVIIVEVTEREKTKLSQQDNTDNLDAIANKMTFKFNNKRARKLIKTYYPTPQGEVTERSVYVNNINSGKAVDLLKAVFPCAAKISVARSTKESSSALVETAGVEETFNYLVVYLQMNINGSGVMLSSVHNDWEGAKKKYEEKEAAEVKKTAGTSSGSGASKKPASGVKTSQPSRSSSSNRAAARGGPGHGSTPKPAVRKDEPVRGKGARGGGDTRPARGGYSRGGGRGVKGAGSPPPSRNAGRTLLPDPPLGGASGGIGVGDGLLPLPAPLPPPPEMMMRGGVGSEGLLPLPHPDYMQPPSLLGLPVKPTPKGIREGEMLGPPEEDYRTLELTEIRQELESRVMETRAQLESHLSKLDQTYRTGLPSAKPRRPVDYLEEEDRSRDGQRRTLLPMEGGMPRVVERDEWLEETAEYRRPPAPTRGPAPIPLPVPPPPPPPIPSALDRGYNDGGPYSGGPYSRGRHEEDYGDDRSRARPYLLEAPQEQTKIHEKPEERQVFDYEHARRRTHIDSEMCRDDSRSLLGHPALLERESGHPVFLERDRSPLRRDYPEERLVYSSHDSRYDYESMDSRRPLPPNYGGYEEDSRRLATVQFNDYDDRRY